MSRGIGIAPFQDPTQPHSVGRMPNTDSVAGLPRKERRSARKIAEWFFHQFEEGLTRRAVHARRWMKVDAIMAGFHYVDVRGGVLRLVPKRHPDEIRAQFPIMVPAYRLELGRFNANDINVSSVPRSGENPQSFYQSDRAQHILRHWIDEISLKDVDDEANQHLLYYGMQAMLYFADPIRKQAWVESIPGPELFPIPYDAPSWRKADGIMRATLFSEQFLEMQDEIFEGEHGRPPERKMARLAGRQSLSPHQSFVGFSAGSQIGGSMSGARGLFIWMKPTEINPHGEMAFMVENELFAYRSGADDKGRSLALPDGKIPLEPVYYDQRPNRFWGYGFCEELVPPQQEIDRQWTVIVRTAHNNGGFVWYDPSRIDANDIQNGRDAGLVKIKPHTYSEGREAPINLVRGDPVTAEVGTVLQLAEQAARKAAGHQSDILTGQAEGRVEGGPGLNILQANAQAPLESVFGRKYRAYKKLYPVVLNMIRRVWPDGKRIRVTGQSNIGREFLFKQQDIPDASELILNPTPIIPNGRNAMMSLLLTLRQLPGEDGNGSEISSAELRQSISLMGMNPPGIDSVDPAEQRIRWRIMALINDLQKPAIPDASQEPVQQFENHRLAVRLLKEAILDPAFKIYSGEVQTVLLREFQFHKEASSGGGGPPPDNFDDAVIRADAQMQDDFLEAAENDPDTSEGTFAPDGIPLGVG